MWLERVQYNSVNSLKLANARGVWVAQSVKSLTLSFGSDHDLMIHEFKPHIGLCAESLLGILSLSLSLSAPPCLSVSVSLSLKINK